MSTLSEFMEARVRADAAQDQPRVRSTSRGPVVVLQGWRKGTDKVAIATLLRQYGVALAEAHSAVERVLRGGKVTVRVQPGADIEALTHELDRLGIVL